MGKRKKAAKPVSAKKKEQLATTFQCLFCNHENSVVVKMEKKIGVGNLSCKVCGQTFQTGINYLSAAVDVYADWIDACDAVAKEGADAAGQTASTTYRDVDVSSRKEAPGRANEYEMDDGFIDDEGAEQYGDEEE